MLLIGTCLSSPPPIKPARIQSDTIEGETVLPAATIITTPLWQECDPKSPSSNPFFSTTRCSKSSQDDGSKRHILCITCSCQTRERLLLIIQGSKKYTAPSKARCTSMTSEDWHTHTKGQHVLSLYDALFILKRWILGNPLENRYDQFAHSHNFQLFSSTTF